MPRPNSTPSSPPTAISRRDAVVLARFRLFVASPRTATIQRLRAGICRPSRATIGIITASATTARCAFEQRDDRAATSAVTILTASHGTFGARFRSRYR